MTHSVKSAMRVQSDCNQMETALAHRIPRSGWKGLSEKGSTEKEVRRRNCTWIRRAPPSSSEAIACRIRGSIAGDPAQTFFQMAQFPGEKRMGEILGLPLNSVRLG